MRVLKYKLFARWAKKQGLNDSDLKQAIDEIERGLVDANLGGSVYKKRIGVQGRGKRGAYRTIIFMKHNNKAIFAHGFAKGEKSNISKQELEDFKLMANLFLSLNDTKLKQLIDDEKLIEVL